jgi:hypothetical protein
MSVRDAAIAAQNKRVTGQRMSPREWLLAIVVIAWAAAVLPWVALTIPFEQRKLERQKLVQRVEALERQLAARG